jgi:predicted Zn-dependent protease
VDAHFITAPPSEEAPLLLKAVLTATAATAPVQPLPSLTLARLYVQQQALDEAVVVLERLLEREPANVEAQDLLALIRDMMAPLPEAPLPARERKIAALQRWLASLTLGRERAAR